MKVKTLQEKAKKEIKADNEKKVMEMVKDKVKEVNSCKKTLKKLEKEMKEFLNTDIDDLELEDHYY